MRRPRSQGVSVALFAHRLMQRNATGIGRYLQELVYALAQGSRAEDSVILASTGEGDEAGWVPERVEQRRVPWPRRPVQLAWCMGTGPQLERSLGPLDIVHLIQPFPPVRSAAPQVVTIHDLFPLEHPEWYPRSERWTYRRSIELTLERAKRIVVPSGWVADRIVATLGVPRAQIDVVPLGVTGQFAGSPPDHEVAAVCARFGVEPGRFAVCVGQVSTRKNMTAVVRALAEPSGAGVPLVLVGPDGHGADRVDAEIARLRGRARVIRTGYVADGTAAALVQSAAVLLHPALGEGFGFVPLEAMAARTPVIAARISSVPEVVGDAAVLVDEPTDPRAWADATATVVESAERRKELAVAGEQRAAAFRWEQTARRMLEIYSHASRS